MDAPDKAPSSIKPWLRRLVGPVVLVLILLMIDRQALLEALAGTRLELAVLAVFTATPAIAVRTVRWRALLASDLERARFHHLFGAYAYAMFLGTVTPGRLGEFVKVRYLTDRGVAPGAAFANVLVDRMFDVAMLLLCGGLGIWWWALPADLRALPAVAAAGAVLLVLGGVALFALRTLAERGGSGVVGKLAAFAEQVLAALRRLSLARVALASALTVASWSLNFLATWLLSESLGLGLGYFTVGGLSAVASIVTLVPVTMLGAGTRDAALIVLLARFGIGEGPAVALSTLFLGMTIAVGMLAGLLGMLRDRPPHAPST